MARRRPRTNLFRVIVSGLIAASSTLAVLLVLVHGAGVDIGDTTQLVTFYVVAWPVNVIVYVTWSSLSYSSLDADALRQVTAADAADESRPLARVLGVTGTTNTTIAAAIAAVMITIVIAQRPEFRTDAFYILLTLLTVASSWVLMVFSFAQSYLRLGVSAPAGTHLRFSFPEAPRFGDYFTFAMMLSASGAALPAAIVSRTAWRVTRINIVIAFVFNSVIIAMMVSLLFGGLIDS